MEVMIELFNRHIDIPEHQILLSYKGRLSHDLVQMFVEQIESVLEQNAIDFPTKRKKIFNVLVEVFQNVANNIGHSNNPSIDDEFKKVSLKVWLEDNFCKIATGNYIPDEKVAKLDHWINHVNSLDAAGVKQLYKDILDNGIFSPTGGGGLGFVDIARKTGQKMNYDFKPVRDGFSYFNFEVSIALEN